MPQGHRALTFLPAALLTFALALALALALGAVACSSSSSTSSGTPEPDAAAAEDAGTSTDDAATGDDVTVHAVFDLPRNATTQSLSATAFDSTTRTLFALADDRPSIIPLVASEDFTSFTVGTPLTLSGRAGSAAWDGEGLVRIDSGFVAVTVETAPTIERFDATGARTGAVTFPAHYAEQAAGNKGLESLAVSPSGSFLFTANESALTIDGTAATKSRGTTVRILKRELATDTDIELAYRTEPLGAGAGAGDMGVSELAAVSDDVLLVLERGFQAGFGNTVRIFRVDLSTGTRVDKVASLTDATPVLDKTLLVDLSMLPSSGITHPSTQPNPILDNYESLALGPTLADGRRLLFVTSDDNASASQVARVLVLAVRGL
jgi:hypothetical protein